MKKILVYFIFSLVIVSISGFLFAPQEKAYDESWKQVEAYVKKGLPKSALKIVDEVYQSAKAEGNETQALKALIYRVSLQSRFEEDHLVKAIWIFEKELASSVSPEKQILHSLLAEMYQWYLNENRWQINDRSTLTGIDNKDIHTWDAAKLNRIITNHYLSSLEQKDKTQSVVLDNFNAILQNTDKGGFILWPTLFDLIGNRALNYFSTDDAGLAALSTYTSLNDPVFFLSAPEFVKQDLGSLSKMSNEYQVLRLYQRLLKIHLEQKNTEALVDLDIRRLQYVYNKNPQSKENDERYIAALTNLRNNYQNYPVFVKISVPLARAHQNQGQKYAPLKGEDYRMEMNTALAICREAVEAFPDAEAVRECKNITTEIKRKVFGLKLNIAELPGKPFLAYINFKNITNLNFKIIVLDPGELLKVRKSEDQKDRIRRLLKKEAVKVWSQELPDTKDHQAHAAEIRMPAMEYGYYMVFASSDSSFASESNIVYQPLWVTNLSYIVKNNTVDGALELYVLDRQSGNAVEGTSVTVYDKVYNASLRGNEFIKLGQYPTNEIGYVNIQVTGKSKHGSINFTLQKEDDQLFSEGTRSVYKWSTVTKHKTKTYLFTDRAIYRPGQTVYFKGIVVDKDKNDVILKTNHQAMVSLIDVNRKEISTLDVLTNDFGSYHGAFVIPRGSLNGQMRIKTKTGSLNFRVEEYKRPTFQVTFDTIHSEYKLGEEITVTGRAENFAGNAIMNAGVNYRVVRSMPVVPYFRSYYRYPVQQDQEISHGQVVTNQDGSFEINFVAEGGGQPSYLKNAPYHFIIYADVTDITGEVQSGSSYVTVGSQALILNIEEPDVIQSETTKGLTVTAKNLSGAAVEVNVQLKVFRLSPPDRLLNKRYWPQPDINLFSAEEFKNEFPYAVFGDENDKNNWAREEVFSQQVRFNGEIIVLTELLKNSKPGEYLVIASTVGSLNDTLSTKKFIQLYATDTKQLPGKMVNWSQVTKTKAEPGEVVKLIVGSAAKKSKLYYEIVNGNEVVESDWLILNRSQKVLDIPVKEAYRGNFEIRTAMIRYNRIYLQSTTIEVPFTNKKLDITLETHRDFLTPGKEEEWRVKISGPNGTGMAAELMAGMYDASLDQFATNQWKFNLYNAKRSRSRWGYSYFKAGNANHLNRVHVDYIVFNPVLYPEINWFGYQHFGGPVLRGMVMEQAVGGVQRAEAENLKSTRTKEGVDEVVSDSAYLEPPPTTIDETVPMRTNFNETAFFYPQLRTDSAGNSVFTFTTPDALTEWKMMLLAYSEDLKTGTFVKKIKAHKDLMIIPNLPRFVRQGDRLVFSAKVVNFTDEPMSAEATIEFFDPVSMKPVNVLTGGQSTAKSLQIAAKQSELIDWEIIIPFDLDMIAYRVKAISETFTDGEERMIPVLTNRILVTETLPLPVKGNETKNFTFEKLVTTGKMMMASTLKNYRFTVEFTSNPAWYAVQALPYLSNPKIPNASNLFHQYYANALSAFIINSNPKIKPVFEAWNQLTPDAFYSNLQKNEDLKNVVLNATPWVLEAEDETEQKRRIGILFDMNRLANEKNNTMAKLRELQLPSGAWSWYNGMREDRHTTQSIVVGIAKLHDKGVIDLSNDHQLYVMIRKAVAFIDGEVQRDYAKLKKNNPKGMKNNNLGSMQVEYLYARSLLDQLFPIPQKSEEAFDFYVEQEKKYWLDKSNYLQGMIALTLNELGHRNEAEGIMRSLKERSLHNDEMGMYWRQERSWFWYEAPVESQAIIIEAFDQIMNDPKSVEQMKIWLLKQKQTSRWKTTSATAESVFALLLTGEDLLSNDQLVQIKVGSEQIIPKQIEGMKVEPGTGYFKTSWAGSEIKSEMGKIEVTNPNKNIAWGAAYWQYFENLDRITSHDSPLSVEKLFLIEELTDNGPVVKPLEEEHTLKTGDKVVIRLVIRTDRNMEYIHVKDMRATALEPMNQLSGYNYKGGLGFYKNITDVSTEFFIRYLNKGTYVLEYPLMVTQKGEFSNGIATIQSYYAPEFAAHSEGLRLVVE